VKRTALNKKIKDAAKAAGFEWVLVRHGGQHDLWRCGTTIVTIPRHNELNELTAQSILKRLEATLGEQWWK
jgi:hypothetical protein